MPRKKKGEPIHGWLILDKPQDMGSTPCVGYAKRIFNAQKAGHGGTLDPLATGLLAIALGEATKTMPFILEATKTYRFTIQFGEERNTDDSDGEVTETSDKRPAKDDILDVLPHFMGEIEQMPPQFSAIKIKGQPAYTLARKGEKADIKARQVTVHILKLMETTGPDEAVETAVLEAHVTKGTYVRSLARDIGRHLGCLGHIIQLRRTQVGPFTEDMGVSKETLDKAVENGESLHPFLLDTTAALDDIPVYRATFKEERLIKSGGRMTRVHLEPGTRQMIAPDGRLISLVEVNDKGHVRVLRNFNQ